MGSKLMQMVNNLALDIFSHSLANVRCRENLLHKSEKVCKMG